MRARMSLRSFGIVIGLFLIYGGTARARDKALGPQAIPLTVRAGVPLHVALEKPVRIKRAGVPMEGHIVEPVYVFDKMVIPAGSKVLGHVTAVEGVSKKRRAMAIANGNFTPLHAAHFEFDTLVLKDGKRLPLQTLVSPGTPNVVHLTAGGEGKKQGRVRQAVEQARQQVKQREHEAIQEVKAPGKVQRLKAMILAELPYRRQVLPVGTQFTAELKTPLDFGAETCPPQELERLGREIPPGSLVHVRLLTPLSSAKDKQESPVEAVVSEPVFSSSHQLILPQGTRLKGFVTKAVPARRLNRNGQLRFTFRQIQLPRTQVSSQAPASPRKVEASLQGVDVSRNAHLKLDTEGGARAVTSKKHYIAPAIDVLLATSSLDFDSQARVAQERAAGSVDTAGGVGGAVRGGAGFGLLGSLIAIVARSTPVTAGFAFYGAAWSVYSHVVARGSEVVFPKNTPMDIRFGTHEGKASKRASL
jgi:hypothetical protein